MIRKRIHSLLLNCYPRWSPMMFKATLAGAFVLAIAAPLAMVAIPFIEFFNGMAAQPKGKAQMTYGRIFGEQLLTTRDPVEGALPHDYHPYPLDHLAAELKVAQSVGDRLQNPVPITMETLRRGQNRFNIFCIPCHGAEGQGDGTVARSGFPAPPSFHTGQTSNYTDGTIYHIVTKGTELMPDYADKLTPEDRWKTIHYVRALQRAMNPKPEDLHE